MTNQNAPSGIALVFERLWRFAQDALLTPGSQIPEELSLQALGPRSRYGLHRVSYRQKMHGNDENEPEGTYDPNDGMPVIALWRPVDRLPREVNEPDLAAADQDVVTLAHEVGHRISHRGGHRPDECEVATRAFQTFKAGVPGSRCPTDSEWALVYEEECRAWDLGREILGSLGYSDWQTFDARRERGLGVYREQYEYMRGWISPTPRKRAER